MRVSTILLVAAVVVASFAFVCASVHESYVTVRLALVQRDVALLESALEAVSSPFSSEYGEFLTPREIGSIIGASHEELTMLTEWLTSDPDVRAKKGSVHVHPTRDYIDVDVPASVAVEMVGDAGQRQRSSATAASGVGGRFASNAVAQKLVDFALFADSAHYHTLRVADKSHSEFAAWRRLPSRVQRRQAYAQKQKHASKKLQKRGLRTDVSGGTPAAQRAAYGVPTDLVGTNSTTQYLWGTGTYGFTPSDLAQYYSTMSLPATEINELVVTDFAGKEGGDNWGEGTLDVSLLSGIAPGILTLVANTDTSTSAEEGDGFGPAMLSWLTGLVANSTTKGLPHVISLSLGSLSWDSCNLLCEGVAQDGNYTYAQCQSYMQQQRQVCMYPDSAGMDRMNVEFLKLGAMGTSVMGATGDGGSHFSFQMFNSDPMGTVLNKVACEANFPTFPAESPYVTGVGGTEWSSDPSTPVAWGPSGGGFSWRFPVPSYQAEAVQTYMTRVTMPPSSAYNSSNRAYPDVAALAANVPVVFAGQLTPAAGTSCSAPEFSALVSLLNDQRLRKGLPALGFLNPVLYALASKPDVYAEIFYDMTTGNNDCDGNGQCCNLGTGFSAAVGWDPTTGLGSPLFAGLTKYLADNDFLDMFQ